MILFSQCQFIFIGGVENFAAERSNIIDLVANLCTFTGMLLNVCHGHDSFLATNFAAQCDSWPQTVPVAAWEVTSIGVLLHGVRTSRVLTLHAKYGPLMLAVIDMLNDMMDWLMISCFIVIAFAGAFHVLYGDPYKDGALLTPTGCIDPDLDFEHFGTTLRIMWEGMLAGDGYFGCLHASTHSFMGPLYGYLFLLITNIMLVNMLVAMMAKSFDEVSENVSKYFLFLKTRIICNWLVYPAVPPPFNMISIPYYIVHAFLEFGTRLLYAGIGDASTDEQGSTASDNQPRTSRISGAISRRAVPLRQAWARRFAWAALHFRGERYRSRTTQEADLPDSWYSSLGEDPLDYLTNKILEFKKDNADESSQMDDFKAEVLDRLEKIQKEASDREALIEMQLGDFKKEVFSTLAMLRKEIREAVLSRPAIAPPMSAAAVVRDAAAEMAAAMAAEADTAPKLVNPSGQPNSARVDNSDRAEEDIEPSIQYMAQYESAIAVALGNGAAVPNDSTISEARQRMIRAESTVLRI